MPIRSPAATRTMLPSASSKTWIGSALSMQSESAGCPSPSGRARSPGGRLGQESGRRVEPGSPSPPRRRSSPSGSPRRRSGAAQRGRRVGREERVARARGEDHDAALLEMSNRTAPDVRLATSETVTADCTRVCAPTFSSASCSASAEQRREHPRVVRGRTVHPPPPLGRDRSCRRRRRRRCPCRLPARRAPPCDRGDRLRVDAVLAIAHQALAREPRAPCERREGPWWEGRATSSWSRAHEPATDTRANDVTCAPASSSAAATVFEASWIHACSRRVPPGDAAKKRLPSMPSTIFSRACSGLEATSSELR